MKQIHLNYFTCMGTVVFADVFMISVSTLVLSLQYHNSCDFSETNSV